MKINHAHVVKCFVESDTLGTKRALGAFALGLATSLALILKPDLFMPGITDVYPDHVKSLYDMAKFNGDEGQAIFRFGSLVIATTLVPAIALKMTAGGLPRTFYNAGLKLGLLNEDAKHVVSNCQTARLHQQMQAAKPRV